VYFDPEKIALAMATVDAGVRHATPAPWPSMSGDSRTAAISPNGAFIAFASDRSGTPEVYVKEFPDGADSWQVSADGGRQPRWARASGELFLLGGSGPVERWMGAVEVRRAAGKVAIGTPKPLFKDPMSNVQTIPSAFEVSADGQRFLVVRRVERKEGGATTPPPEPHLVVVQNWFSEFAKR
jgi:hypothetical protein